MSVESQCRFKIYSTKCFLEVINGVGGNDRIRYYMMRSIWFQAHLLSVFDNVHTVTFDEKAYDNIVSLNSQEGEVVDLEKRVIATVRFVSILIINCLHLCVIYNNNKCICSKLNK